MREVYPHIYLNEIPLPNNPLKAINNFLVVGDDEYLMVDTAFDMAECRKSMEDLIEDHAIDITKLTVFLTHLHSDHTGLAPYLQKSGARLVMGKIDGDAVNFAASGDPGYVEFFLDHLQLQGMAADNLTVEDHPGFTFRPKEKLAFDRVLSEGDLLEIGDFAFEVLDLPGHTPGLQGLYDRDKKILFAGDHILGKITPNITFWSFEVGDSLGTYFESLEKVRQLELDFLFSSHRHLVDDVNSRIDELLAHHAERLQECLAILERHGECTVREVTKNLQWDIRAKDWSDFPNPQKWFAAGEAMAHLEHLLALGKVKREKNSEGVLVYSL